MVTAPSFLAAARTEARKLDAIRVLAPRIHDVDVAFQPPVIAAAGRRLRKPTRRPEIGRELARILLARLLVNILASAVFFPVFRTKERRVFRATDGTVAAPLATDDAEARALLHGIGICRVERGSSGIHRRPLRYIGRGTRFTYGAFA